MINTSALPLLPYHPKFERRESISSYVIRLANENGYFNLNTFLQIVFSTKQDLQAALFGRIRNDFAPRGDFRNLPALSGCTENELLATTFEYLFQYFPMEEKTSYAIRSLGKHCLKRTFSYCPACVREYGYYSLLWRFRNHPGCSEHALSLVGHCYKCKATLPLPLSRRNARIGRCPLCNADLTLAPAANLSSESLILAQDFEHNIEYLISPHEPSQYLEVGRPQSRKNVLDYIRFNFDRDLTEFRVFADFKDYFQMKIGDRPASSSSPDPIRALFTFYWLGSSANKFMELYLKYRDDPCALMHELGTFRPSIPGNKYVCKYVSWKANHNLPSMFDFIPLNLERLHGLKLRMSAAVSKFQGDLYYYPENFYQISQKMLDEIVVWQNEIQQLRGLRTSEY